VYLERGPIEDTHTRVREITGHDPLPYGIEPNRHVLEEIIRSALEQRIITRPVTVEELFASATRGLTA
jgi:4,5-dihydroxyphthalate decarboxylase